MASARQKPGDEHAPHHEPRRDVDAKARRQRRRNEQTEFVERPQKMHMRLNVRRARATCVLCRNRCVRCEDEAWQGAHKCSKTRVPLPRGEPCERAQTQQVRMPVRDKEQ